MENINSLWLHYLHFCTLKPKTAFTIASGHKPKCKQSAESAETLHYCILGFIIILFVSLTLWQIKWDDQKQN